MEIGAGESGELTHAVGYSGFDDPQLGYCSDVVSDQYSSQNNWYIDSCENGGGSSGGPWLQNMDKSTGIGNVIAVVSWGWNSGPGQAGAKLVGAGNSFLPCVFDKAETEGDPGTDGFLVDFTNQVCSVDTPPPCGSAGSACTSGSDCCSGSCRGRRGRKTCR